MSTLDQSGKANQGEIRYLTPLDIATKIKKNIVGLKDLVLSISIIKILISF
mgnify:CR=1 FL=1